MKFVAQSIIAAHFVLAPKEYEEILIIADSKPKGTYDGIELRQIEKTNVVAWFVKSGKNWRLASGYFIVSKARIKHARGARYTKEKEAFVQKYYKDLFDYIITRKLTWRDAEVINIVRLAREEVGYSEITSPVDVFHGITKEFMKQYKK